VASAEAAAEGRCRFVRQRQQRRQTAESRCLGNPNYKKGKVGDHDFVVTWNGITAKSTVHICSPLKFNTSFISLTENEQTGKTVPIGGSEFFYTYDGTYICNRTGNKFRAIKGGIAIHIVEDRKLRTDDGRPVRADIYIEVESRDVSI
jgi:hypothetical protein